jgi:hypothetical protein
MDSSDLTDHIHKLLQNQRHCREVWEDYHGKDEILTEMYNDPFSFVPIDSDEKLFLVGITVNRLVQEYINDIEALVIEDDISKASLWFSIFAMCPSARMGASLLCVFHSVTSQHPRLALQDEEFSFAIMHYLLVGLINRGDRD